MSGIKKITITGTKGKTTVANMLDFVVRDLDSRKVLLVNTTGHFINGERKSNLDDSKGNNNWGLVPSVCPGRYLFEFIHEKDGVAILEASLGSSTLAGLGYTFHDIGIFLNVFEDHIGNSDRIRSPADIVEAKSFVASRCRPEGKLVLNFNDDLVMGVLDSVERAKEVEIIFFGLNLQPDIVENKKINSDFVTVRGGTVVYYNHHTKTFTNVLDITDVSWTFNGLFQPSVYNLLAVVAGALAFNKDWLPFLGQTLKESHFDTHGGRLTQLKAKNGSLIIADYAHETRSLMEIANLAKKLTGPRGKVIGVVRLAYDRTDELIKDTGRAIATMYDYLIVYDKIDGYWRKPKPLQEMEFRRFPQVIGKISDILSKSILEINSNCERIIREDEAIHRAAKLAGPEDVVVIIVNDNINRSIEFIQDKFEANFL